MPVSNSKFWLQRWLLQRKTRHMKGFTLIEVLVSMLIAGLVLSTLLYLVVELLRIDRRELSLERVQRDTQRAMDYIADDLKEAVYVYSTPDTVTNNPVLKDLYDDLAANNGEPVLAFWRPDPIEETLPGVCSTTADEELCSLLKTRRATYTLVVYYQQPQSGVYSGQSHIRRYELEQYADISTFTENDGYIDPISSDDGATNFEDWAPDADVDDGTDAVLVDYIDAVSLDPLNSYSCQTLINDANSAVSGAVAADDYVLSPADAEQDEASFFACIRNIDSAGSFRTGQDVYLFMRGNAAAANGTTIGLSPASDGSRLPVLQTLVRVRGIINKDG